MDHREKRVRQIHPSDNVVTALADLPEGTVIQLGDVRVVARNAIPFGHKMALTRIPCGDSVVKYGEVIGIATTDIAAGEHVHSHNLVTQRGRQRR
jgi:altronate dehydratase